MLKLSICISTYRRADFLGQTLDSIIPQLGPEVELVVVDGASPDNTPQVMGQYLSRHPEIRYFREQDNSGVDHDYDKAVGYARGGYCWLMTDDDLLHPGAVAKVLAALGDDPDLVVVNAETRNADLAESLEPRRLNLETDRVFGEGQEQAFFSTAANFLSFIGCVVIKRAFWLARDRPRYYGTLFIHIGVIFQHPPLSKARLLSEPLIVIRYGNAMWSGRSFEIWEFKWPQLIWSFTHFSEDARRAVSRLEPWRRTGLLLRSRATGAYSITEYRRFLASRLEGLPRVLAYLIAVLPAGWINTFAVVYYGLGNHPSPMGMFDLLRSTHSTSLGRLLARRLGFYKGSIPQ